MPPLHRGGNPARRLRPGDRGQPLVQPAPGPRRDQRAGTRQLHRPRPRSRQGQLRSLDRQELRPLGRAIRWVVGMTDFLLELRSEEIPARMQAGARAELEKLFRKEMAAAGVSIGEVTVWSTPRRLALIARDLPQATQPVREEAKG